MPRPLTPGDLAPRRRRRRGRRRGSRRPPRPARPRAAAAGAGSSPARPRRGRPATASPRPVRTAARRARHRGRRGPARPGPARAAGGPRRSGSGPGQPRSSGIAAAVCRARPAGSPKMAAAIAWSMCAWRQRQRVVGVPVGEDGLASPRRSFRRAAHRPATGSCRATRPVCSLPVRRTKASPASTSATKLVQRWRAVQQVPHGRRGRCSRRWPGRLPRSAPPGPAEPLGRRSRSARTSRPGAANMKRACEVSGS